MTSGSGKIKCVLCGKWEGHIIVPHLKEAHPKVSVYEYLEEKGGELASPHGFEILRRTHGTSVAGIEARETKSIWETFGLEKWDGKDQTRKWVSKTVEVYTHRHALSPAVDPDYVFQEHALKRVLLGLALKERNRVWLHGTSGTGKTTTILQVLGRLNRPVMRLQGSSAISRRHLVGDWTVRNGETVFVHGLAAVAFEQGHYFLVDEIDSLDPRSLNDLRPMFEDPPTFVIPENGNEVLRCHPDFRAGATANTAGGGDETGLYVTTRALSEADRQRFSLWAKVDFMPAAQETGMLKKKFPKLSSTEIRRFYQVVKAIRERSVSGEFEASFSPRELINWVEKYFLTANPMEAASMCFLDRYSNPAVQTAVSELVRAAFDDQKTPDPLPGES